MVISRRSFLGSAAALPSPAAPPQLPSVVTIICDQLNPAVPKLPPAWWTCRPRFWNSPARKPRQACTGAAWRRCCSAAHARLVTSTASQNLSAEPASRATKQELRKELIAFLFLSQTEYPGGAPLRA